MRPSRRTTVGLAFLAAQPLAIVVELVGVAAIHVTGSAPYDLARNTISDIGAVGCGWVDYPFGPVAVCSPLHSFVNAGFAVFGVVLAVGAWAVRPLLPAGPLRTWTAGCWIVAGGATTATACVPLDADPQLHTLVSTPLFLAQIALLLNGILVRRVHPRLGWTGIVAGVLSTAAATYFLLVVDAARLGGLWERLAIWPGSLWLAALAAALHIEAGRAAITPH